MAQADQQIQDATFPAVRADINDNLAALFSQSSGVSAPTVTKAYQPWIDTSSSPAVWKLRNGADTGWITIGTIDATTFAFGGLVPITNGGTGATTAAAALAALLPSQSGNAGKGLTTDGTTAGWNTIASITAGVAVASTSGTSINFTSIPSTAKRITVIFQGVSTNGTSAPLVQLGTSAGVTTTGYASTGSAIGTGTAVTSSTSGIVMYSVSAAALVTTQVVLTNISGNTWVASYVGKTSTAGTIQGGGDVTLSGVLDRLRITTVGGTDTFDAGTINIFYE